MVVIVISKLPQFAYAHASTMEQIGHGDCVDTVVETVVVATIDEIEIYLSLKSVNILISFFSY